MDNLNSSNKKAGRFRNRLVYGVVILVLAVSFYWLWHMDRVLTEQSEWCRAQEEPQPLEVCWGIAERDVQRTYYLKVIMLSVLAFGSTGLLLATSKKESV